MLKKTLLTLFAFMLCLSSAFAEEQLGVAVYPGAKYDQARTNLLRQSLSVRGGAYRTNDTIDSVIAFYHKQGLLYLKTGNATKELARFKKADTGVDVLIQNPWKDARTGAMMTDTLILIFQHEEQGNMPDSSI
jgi:hypothetical protein